MTAPETMIQESATREGRDFSSTLRHALPILVPLIAFLPLALLHGRQLWLREHYQFFPFLFLGAGVLALDRTKTLGPLAPGRPVVFRIELLLVWCMLAFSTLLWSPWLGAISAVLLVVALVYRLGGWALLKATWPALFLLCLLIPPPLNLDQRLVRGLQVLTARWSDRILDLAGVIHVMQGNVVVLPQRHLMVEEACSGINSLFSIVTFTLFYVLWARRPFFRSALLLLAAIAWVLTANTFRVVIIATALQRWNLDLVTGWKHEALGAGLFTLMLLLIWSSDRLLQFLDPFEWFRKRDVFSPLPATTSAGALKLPETPTRWPRLDEMPAMGWIGATGFTILGLVGFGLLGLSVSAAGLNDAPLIESLDRLQAASLPQSWNQWRQIGFEPVRRERDNAFGEHSRVWRYRNRGIVATFSVDYAFAGWHELTDCYRANGWDLVARQPIANPDGEGGTMPGIEAILQKPLEQSACLYFGILDERGQALQPADSGKVVAAFQDRVAAVRGIKTLAAALTADAELPTYQTQVFLQSYSPLSEQDKAQAHALFEELTNVVRSQIRP